MRKIALLIFVVSFSVVISACAPAQFHNARTVRMSSLPMDEPIRFEQVIFTIDNQSIMLENPVIDRRAHVIFSSDSTMAYSLFDVQDFYFSNRASRLGGIIAGATTSIAAGVMLGVSRSNSGLPAGNTKSGIPQSFEDINPAVMSLLMLPVGYYLGEKLGEKMRLWERLDLQSYYWQRKLPIIESRK